MHPSAMWMEWLGAMLAVILLLVTIRAAFFVRPWTRVGVLATFSGLIGAGVAQAGVVIEIEEVEDQLRVISAGFAVGVMAGALLGVVVYRLTSYKLPPTGFDGSDAAIFLIASLVVSGLLAIPGVGAILFWLVMAGVVTLVGIPWS